MKENILKGILKLKMSMLQEVFNMTCTNVWFPLASVSIHSSDSAAKLHLHVCFFSFFLLSITCLTCIEKSRLDLFIIMNYDVNYYFIIKVSDIKSVCVCVCVCVCVWQLRCHKVLCCSPILVSF